MRLKLFLSLMTSAVLPVMAQTAVVTGSVIDADTGSPIPGAVITIQDQGISVTAGPAGDFRISNFLLYQIAYTELTVTPTYWPDYSADDFRAHIAQYQTRQRRFGLTGEQVEESS